MKRLSRLGIVAAIALSACSQNLPTYRYRMTVEVETPEGLRTGSSVIEVRTVKGGGFPGPEAGGIASSVKGEAVAVDLGPRGTLFALLTSSKDSDFAAGAAPTALLPRKREDPGTPDAWGEDLKAMKQVKDAAALPPSYYPMLVRFRDIRDPRTVEEVDPDNLAQAFGPGTSLRKVGVEITDDDLEWKLKDVLPWLEQYVKTGATLNGSTSVARFTNDLDDTIGAGSFTRR